MERSKLSVVEAKGPTKDFSKEQIEKRNRQILDMLAALGGKTFDDDDIIHEGDKMVLPLGMGFDTAIRFLEKKRDEMEKVTEFSHQYNYRPYDGAFCMWNAMKKTFGAVGHKGTMGFFGPNPPEMMSVPVDVGEHDQIPWGRFDLPFLPGATFATQVNEHLEYGPLFRLTCLAPKKYRHEIEGVFNLVEEELQERSLYRGKAFDGQEMPEFVDLSGVRPEQVVYSEEVMTQLSASVWTQLRHTQQCERLGIATKRAVLLFGPYGTGKTLAATLTGQEATANGWTFIKARPGRDNLAQVLQTARLYQPACVFYEDVDQIAGSDVESGQAISRLLDDFDGIEAKGTKILVVLTTNHPERIHKGMARPGRLDAMIEINELDQNGVEKLVRSRIPVNMLDANVDWSAVFRSSDGYKPAFVTEFADRAMRYTLARNNGDLNGHTIITSDLTDAAASLRPQFEIMEGAKDTRDRDTLTDALREAVAPVAETAAETAVRRHVGEQFLNPEDVAAKAKERAQTHAR